VVRRSTDLQVVRGQGHEGDKACLEGTAPGQGEVSAGPDRKKHPDELRAQVVAALLSGDSERFVAQKFGVGRTTARRWLAETRAAAGSQAIAPASPNAAIDRDGIGNLIGLLIQEELKTLVAQAVAFRDPDWLSQQTAGELAVLHGVMADKAFRVIAALQPSPDEGPEDVQI
jgi:transposase-like protein